MRRRNLVALGTIVGVLAVAPIVADPWIVFDVYDMDADVGTCLVNLDRGNGAYEKLTYQDRTGNYQWDARSEDILLERVILRDVRRSPRLRN